jgi:hypothetical protein
VGNFEEIWGILVWDPYGGGVQPQILAVPL